MITSSGLSWWQSWLCVWIGYSISGLFVCLTGRIGAKYHIGFSVVTRSSFGIWGSLWPVFNRAAMACVWYGVQAWIGGTCVKLMIRSVWTSYEDLPNSMPESSGTNTRDFVAFLLFWVGSLPAIWFPVHKVRHLFTVKAFIVPVAGIAASKLPLTNRPSLIVATVLHLGNNKGPRSRSHNQSTVHSHWLRA